MADHSKACANLQTKVLNHSLTTLSSLLHVNQLKSAIHHHSNQPSPDPPPLKLDALWSLNLEHSMTTSWAVIHNSKCLPNRLSRPSSLDLNRTLARKGVDTYHSNGFFHQHLGDHQRQPPHRQGEGRIRQTQLLRRRLSGASASHSKPVHFVRFEPTPNDQLLYLFCSSSTAPTIPLFVLAYIPRQA
jgi:hypothetical protein